MHVNNVTQEMLDDLSVMTAEEMSASDRDLGMGMLETAQKQLDLGLIEAAKSTLKTAISYLNK